MASWAVYAIGIAAGYLAGAIPFGFLIGKSRGIDVRQFGSHNIGATNVYRVVGKLWGVLAFICDFLKGLLPTLAAKHYAATAGDTTLAYLAIAVGLAAVFGHMFTCFMRFKGGKGVATGFGLLVGLVPPLAGVAFLLFAIVVALSHYISLGSILAATFLGVAVWLKIPYLNAVPPPPAICALVSVLAVFVVWKHRTNIQRLLQGKENKIF